MNDFGFDGHGKIEAELEQELKEDVLLGAVNFQILRMRFKAGGEVGADRVPRLDVAAIQLEDAEAEVAWEHWVLVANLLPGAAQAFPRYLGEIVERRNNYRFGQLVEYVASIATIASI